MATSGSYDFNPSLGEIVIYSYQNIGVRPTAILQEHMDSARMATNMMLARWANQGVNLWCVDLVTTPLLQGSSSYPVDFNTVMILDAYIATVNDAGVSTDRIILPVSRTEYASYPNKAQQGFPTVYWFDRLIAPSVTLWPVPDGSQTELRYYRVRQIQDSNIQNAEQVEIPYLWLEAFADGLAYRLARIWNPQIAPALKAQADESYDIASRQNVEQAQQYISPMISGYFR
jgi:hypothetical protein